MKITLKRLEYTPGGTLGRVTDQDGRHICFTVERPWRDNARNVSCIPPGLYDLRWEDSPKFGHRLHVVDVPGRTHILFHSGNRIEDSRGCILPCTDLGYAQNGMVFGKLSRDAVTVLEDELKGFRHMKLEIVEPGASREYHPRSD